MASCGKSGRRRVVGADSGPLACFPPAAAERKLLPLARIIRRVAVVGLCVAGAALLSKQASAFDQGRFLEAYSARVSLIIYHDDIGDPAVKFAEYASVGPYGGNTQPVYSVPEGHDVSFDCRMLVDAVAGMTASKAPKDVWKLLYSVRVEPDPAQPFYQIVDPADVFSNAQHHAKRALHFLKWRARGAGDHQVVCQVTDPAGLSIQTAILRVVPLPKVGNVHGGMANASNTPSELPTTNPGQIARPMQPIAKAQTPVTVIPPAKSGPADLVITAATVRLAEHCAPNQPVLLARVTVRNVGGQPAPAKSGVGMVQARDTVTANWGNGTGTPKLAPGKSAQLSFPIYYLIAHPAAMTGHHAFELTVNSGHWVNEAYTDNNRYGPVSVTIPAKFCAAGGTLKPAGPGAVQSVSPKLNPQPEPPAPRLRLPAR